MLILNQGPQPDTWQSSDFISSSSLTQMDFVSIATQNWPTDWFCRNHIGRSKQHRYKFEMSHIASNSSLIQHTTWKGKISDRVLVGKIHSSALLMFYSCHKNQAQDEIQTITSRWNDVWLHRRQWCTRCPLCSKVTMWNRTIPTHHQKHLMSRGKKETTSKSKCKPQWEGDFTRGHGCFVLGSNFKFSDIAVNLEGKHMETRWHISQAAKQILPAFREPVLQGLSTVTWRSWWLTFVWHLYAEEPRHDYSSVSSFHTGAHFPATLKGQMLLASAF